MPPTLQQLGIDKLSLDDRIALMGELEENVNRELAELGLTRAHYFELLRRVENSKNHPERAIPWEVVKAEILARHQAIPQ